MPNLGTSPNKPEDVFILGAGFSHDVASYPLLKDLRDKVLSEVDRGDEDINKWLESEVPDSIKSNIEYLLSYLHQSFPWRNEKDQHRAKAVFIAVSEAIIRIFHSKFDNANNPRSSQDFLELLKYWHRNESAIITFNYDTLIEEAARKNLFCKKWEKERNFGKGTIIISVYAKDDYPRYQSNDVIFHDSHSRKRLEIFVSREELEAPKSIEDKVRKALENQTDHEQILEAMGVSEFSEQLRKNLNIETFYQFPLIRLGQRTHSLYGGPKYSPTFKLFKLHGSINWLRANVGDKSEGELYLDVDCGDNSLYERNKSDLTPVIIPPVLDKSALYATRGIFHQWAKSSEIIRNAKRLFIVGYSFPQTDLAVNFFIADAIKRNKTIHVIVFNVQGSSDTCQKEKERTETYYRDALGYKDINLEIQIIAPNLKSTSSLISRLKRQD